MLLRTLACFLAAIAPLLAQTAPAPADQPQPAVDQALRSRVQQFYQDFIDLKFHAADALVAEDSKDFFFEMQKTHFKACEVGKITYAENYSKALVVSACNVDFVFRGLKAPSIAPITSRWELQNSDWYWTAPKPDEARSSPFGSMKSGPAETSDVIPKNPGAPVPGMLSGVKVSRSKVELLGDKPVHEEVEIANHMAGHVKLGLAYHPLTGLKLALGKTDLYANEKTILTLDYEPSGAPPLPLVARVIVSPTGMMIPIRIQFTADPPAPAPTAR